MHFKETQYGFEWGGVSIERWMSDEKKGWVYFGLKTGKETLEFKVFHLIKMEMLMLIAKTQ